MLINTNLKYLKNTFFFISNDKLNILLNFTNSNYNFFGYSRFVKSSDLTSHLFNDFLPKPSFFYPSFFYNHIVRLYSGIIFGVKFSKHSLFYSFFVGLYFYCIWSFGGGYRILPVFSQAIDLRYSRIGFYDLRFTPLGVIFHFYMYISWYFGKLDPKTENNSVFYNETDIFRGPFFRSEVSNWLEQFQVSQVSFFQIGTLWHIFFFVLFALFNFFYSFVVHFFLRPLFAITFYFFLSRFFKYYYFQINLFYDFIFKRIYLNYIKRVRFFVTISESERKKLEPIHYDQFYLPKTFISYFFFRRLKVSFSSFSPGFLSILFSRYFTFIISDHSFQQELLARSSNLAINSAKRIVIAKSLSFSSTLPNPNFVYPYETNTFVYNSIFEFFYKFKAATFHVFNSITKDSRYKISSIFYLGVNIKSLFVTVYPWAFAQQFKNITVNVFCFFYNSLSFFYYFFFYYFCPNPEFFDFVKNSGLVFYRSLFFIFWPFVVIFYMFKLWRRYISLFADYFYSIFVYGFRIFSKTFYFKAYYSYYSYFQRFFISSFFMRFYSREVEDEIDQIKDFFNLDFTSSEDIDSTNFEFCEGLDFDDSSFSEFSFYNSSIEYQTPDTIVEDALPPSTIFKIDPRFFESSLFQQIFFGWIGINYAHPETYSNFLQVTLEGDEKRFFEKYNISFFNPTNINTDFHIENELYDGIEWGEKYSGHAEFYYDPTFQSSDVPHRYYDFNTSERAENEIAQQLITYRGQLDKWYQQTSKHLIKIPHELVLSPIDFRHPVSYQDWQILTDAMSSVILRDSKKHLFSFKKDFKIISEIWEKSSEIFHRNPDRIFSEIKEAKFDEFFSILENRFSKKDFVPNRFAVSKYISGFLSILFGSNRYFYEDSKFYKILLTSFSFGISLYGDVASFIISNPKINYEKVDSIYYAYTNFYTSEEFDPLNYINSINRLEVLSSIFYFRYLADKDFLAFYKFIHSPQGSLFWKKFESAFCFSTKYAPTNFDYAYPNSEAASTVIFFYNLYVETAGRHEVYNNKNASFESIFFSDIEYIQRFFTSFYPDSSSDLLYDVHPANLYGVGMVPGNESFNSDAQGMWHTYNWLFTSSFDAFYDYFLDPTIATLFFPSHYVDYIEDIYELDDADFELDIDDYYISGTEVDGSLHAIPFYLNEGYLNDDAEEELDSFDPSIDSEEDLNIGFTTGIQYFENDDPETAGDLPFFESDIEIYIDDHLEGTEDWEPNELDAAEDVSIPIDRLFFGSLSPSNSILPSTDQRLFINVLFNKDNKIGDDDLNYLDKFNTAYSSAFEKAIVPVEKFCVSKVDFTPALPHPNLLQSIFKFLFLYIFYFYFWILAFWFNLVFYTYSKDINHLYKEKVYKHYTRFQIYYELNNRFSYKLKDWILGYENLYTDNSYFSSFKQAFYIYGTFFIPPKLKQYNQQFFNYQYHIPGFSMLLGEGDRLDQAVEMSFIIVYSNQDYTETDYFYSEQIDIYDNSRFNNLNELEFFYLDDLVESSPLDNLFNEPYDWDIGATFSYSADDFLSDTAYFTNKLSIFITACSSFKNIIFDYYLYFYKVKIYRYFWKPFYYWNTRSTYEWARLSSTYGPSIYFFKYLISLGLIFTFFLYIYFIIPRIFYWFFHNTLDYGLFSLLTSFVVFFLTFIVSLFFLHPLWSFWQSLSRDERFSFWTLIFLVWLNHIFAGYMRDPWSVFDSIGLDRHRNLGTESDTIANPRSQIVYPMYKHTVEAGRSIDFYDIRRQRELVYESEKFSGEFNRRQIILGLSYTKAPITPTHFYQYLKYQIFGIRNSYFTGYKYIAPDYDEAFIRQVREAYHNFFHRHYTINLGGVPDNYKRLARRRLWDVYSGILNVKIGYSYSVQLSDSDLSQIVSPASTIIENPLIHDYEDFAPYPYDFRSSTFYNERPQYGHQFIGIYGSLLLTHDFNTTYNNKFVYPRKKIRAFTGRYYNSNRQSKKYHNRRLTNFIYRNTYINRFKHFYKNKPLSLSPFEEVYVKFSSNHFYQKFLKRNQFKYIYASNFSKFILYFNFAKSKDYIDFFTFKPSQLHPRAKYVHTNEFKRYFNSVYEYYEDGINSQTKFKDVLVYDELIEFLDEEKLKGNATRLAEFNARFFINTRSAYSKLYKLFKFERKKYRNRRSGFVNFLRYSRFVNHYNNYIIMVTPSIKNHYFSSLSATVSPYNRSSLNFTNLAAYRYGLVSAKFKTPFMIDINSPFSRSPDRRIRRKYKGSDLLSYSDRFNYLIPNVNNSYIINTSYYKKYKKGNYYHRIRFLRKNNRKFSPIRKYVLPFKNFNKKRKGFKRIVSRVNDNYSPFKYKKLFNDKIVYKKNFLTGYLGFNRSQNPKSKPQEKLKEYEKKLKDPIVKLGASPNITTLSGRVEVNASQVGYSAGFDFFDYNKHSFDYYKYSPINYAYVFRKFKLIERGDRPTNSFFSNPSFYHDEPFEIITDFKRSIKEVFRFENFNRASYFMSRKGKKLYKPYFYRYLKAGIKTRTNLHSVAQKKKYKEEFINGYLLRKINREKVIRSYVRKILSPKAKKSRLIFKNVIARNPRLRRIISAKTDKEIKALINKAKRGKKLAILKAQEEYDFYTNLYADKVSNRYDTAEVGIYVQRKKKNYPNKNSWIPRYYFSRPIVYDEKLGEADIILAKEKRRKKAELYHRRKIELLKQEKDFLKKNKKN